MKILVTGAKGFVGRNLCLELNNIKEGKACCWGEMQVDEVFEYDLGNTPEELEAWCREADFVFNLAGVNRPQNAEDFMKGNFGFASTLLDTLEACGNKCPVMIGSSKFRFYSSNSFCRFQPQLAQSQAKTVFRKNIRQKYKAQCMPMLQDGI